MSEMIDRVADAIDKAQIGHTISLVRLVDGVFTYNLTVEAVDGSIGPFEFPSYSAASDYVSKLRRTAAARAALTALFAPTEAMFQAARDTNTGGEFTDNGSFEHDLYEPMDIWTAMLDEALK